MNSNIKELIKKYPKYKKEIELIEDGSQNLTNYFASIIIKKEFTVEDMFFQSVVNRTNQCISASIFCLLNDFPLPLVNIIRQMIEIYAINEYILDDQNNNFKKACFGKKGHDDDKLKLPNIYTIVEKLKGKEEDILKLYDDYSNISHPNSKSVFSIFKGEEKEGEFYTEANSLNSPIEENIAYHLIRNIGGIANRIYLTTKKLNSQKRYIQAKDMEFYFKND